MTSPASSPRIPARLLYWGRLPHEAAKQSSEAQNYRFERILPFPVDQLHTARARLPGGGVLIVGIEPERLRSHLATRDDVTPRTWELLPDRLPEHVAPLVAETDTNGVMDGLNLLQGQFEPESRRSLRRRVVFIMTGGLLVAAALVMLGIEQRTNRLQQHSKLIRAESSAVIARAVTVQAGDRHPELRLTMELRRLEQANAGNADDGLDVVGALTALLRQWPKDMRTQIETIAAMNDRLVIRGIVPSLSDTERLAQACRTLDPSLKLRAQPLQAQVNERGAGFLLTFVRQDSTAGSRP